MLRASDSSSRLDYVRVISTPIIIIIMAYPGMWHDYDQPIYYAWLRICRHFFVSVLRIYRYTIPLWKKAQGNTDVTHRQHITYIYYNC